MRWLVPTASAISRRERSPIPPLASSAMSASRSSARRCWSGGRGIRVTPLDARLQAFAFHHQAPLGKPTNHEAHHHTDRAALFDPLADDGAIRVRSKLVRGDRDAAQRLLPSRPRDAGIHRNDLPHGLGEPRPPDVEKMADRYLWAVQGNHALDRPSPLRPTFDIRVHIPDE